MAAGTLAAGTVPGDQHRLPTAIPVPGLGVGVGAELPYPTRALQRFCVVKPGVLCRRRWKGCEDHSQHGESLGGLAAERCSCLCPCWWLASCTLGIASGNGAKVCPAA